MKVEINMINVEDGDAIIVELYEKQKSAVILIDGGRSKYYQNRLKPTLENVLKKHHKEGPDLVVCTHYDADHIEGVLNLLDDYKCAIKRIWVHPHPSEIRAHLEEIREAYLSSQREKMITNIRTFENYKLLTETFNDINGFNIDGLNLIIESLGQLENLFDKIKRINVECRKKGRREIIIEHPTRGKSLEDWREFKVEGPTQEYLNDCFKTFSDKRKLLISEASFYPLTYREIELMKLHEAKSDEEITPCLNLTTSSKISATNRSSIICSAQGEKGKYLFTGDAGLESFSSIPSWETELEGIYWLDVPHHGSWNNTSRRMIEVFRPQFAFVSGDAKDNRPHLAIKACLEDKGAQVEITNEKPETVIIRIDFDGNISRK